MIIDGTKQVALDAAVLNYTLRHSSAAADPHLRACRDETLAALPDRAVMQIDPLQAAFMTCIASLAAAGNDRPTAVEVGTFTGYSAIAIAKGLGTAGRILCFDSSERFTDIAKRHWSDAGLHDRIALTLGDARDTLAPTLDANGLTASARRIDLAFIDADKPAYAEYFETLLPCMRRNGLILFDNTLWNGDVVDADAAHADPHKVDAERDALHALNERLTADPRVETCVLPFADGITIARVLASA